MSQNLSVEPIALESLPTLAERRAARLVHPSIDRVRPSASLLRAAGKAPGPRRSARHEVKPELKIPAGEPEGHELPTGFSKGGADLRGHFPDVLALRDRLVTVARQDCTGAKRSGLGSTGWSLALRLAAAEIDELRKSGKVEL
jgi:hypothetical protein